MAGLTNIPEVLHKIHVRLYPNHLPTVEGEYIARPKSDSMLTIEEICATLKKRGGFTGSYDDLVSHVKLFLDEAAYQLCDGYSVNFEYYSIHPKIKGTFNKKHEHVNEDNHPVTFVFRIRNLFRELLKFISVIVDGLADTGGYIDAITDISTGAVNESVTPGKNFVITGLKLKIAGNPMETGVFFTTPGAPGKPDVSVGVTENFAENDPAKIIGIVPALERGKKWTLEIRTTYSGAGKPLKKVRVISRKDVQLTVNG
jgi:hypothetical protein